jgi:hypothetical protein
MAYSNAKLKSNVNIRKQTLEMRIQGFILLQHRPTQNFAEQYSKFEVFTVVKFQVEFFWVVTPCSAAVGYYSFGRPCCHHLQGEELERKMIGYFAWFEFIDLHSEFSNSPPTPGTSGY